MTVTTQEQYEEIIVRQLAGHYLNDEWDDYEFKLDQLEAEYEEEPESGFVIGNREYIERMVIDYLS